MPKLKLPILQLNRKRTNMSFLTKSQPGEVKFHNYVKRNNNLARTKRFVMFMSLLAFGLIIYSHKEDVMAFAGDYNSISQYVRAAAPADYQQSQVLGDSSIKSSIQMLDVRAYIFDQYFLENKSPLYGTGNLFVAACDHYGAPYDCISVVAIARAETDLCKYHTSATYYNCWGFGGGGQHRIYFNSWEQSIYRVTDTLVNKYGLEYMINPSLMEKTFCGSEPGCTGWGNRVKYHMKIINEYPASLGFNFKLTDLKK